MQKPLPLVVVLLCSFTCFSPAIAQEAPKAPDTSERARVFITDSQSWEVGGYAGGGPGGGGSVAHGGARPQTAEIIKTFGERCPEVMVNNIQEKTDYIVLLDHEGGKGLLRHKNKVAVFARVSGDSIVSKSTLSLGGSVQEACGAISNDWALLHARAPEDPSAQLAKAVDVSRVERATSIQHSLVFIHYVAATLVDCHRQIGGVFLELFGRNIAQGVDLRIPSGENSHAFVTLLAAPVIFAAREFVLDHGVAKYQPYTGRDGDQFIFERTAVEPERVSRFSKAGNKLIHNAYARTHESILGVLAQPCYLWHRKHRAVQAHQGQSAGYLNRGR